MNKGILWVIKIIVIFIVITIMTVAKEIGIPIVIKNIIGLAIIYAVWKYNPNDNEDDNSSSSQELNKN